MDGSVSDLSAPSERVRVLLDAATAVRETDPAAARRRALEARVHARACGDRSGEAEAVFQLATIAHAVGDSHDAHALALEADHLAATVPEPLVQARAAHLVAIVHYEAGNHAEARTYCLRALELHRSVEHDVDEANLLNTLAAVHQALGDHDGAIDAYEAALAVTEPFGRLGFAALVYGNLARIRAQRAEYLPAVTFCRRAIDLARDHRPEVVSNLLADLAESYMGLAEPQRAIECFAEARRASHERALRGDRPSSTSQLGVLMAEGRVALRRNALDEAATVLGEALDLAGRSDRRDFEVEIHGLLAEVLKRSGRFEEALEHRERHAAGSREMVDRSADLRLRTLQVAHDSVTARQRSEIFQLRERVPPDVGAVPAVAMDDPATMQLDAFERLAILAEFRDVDTGQHTKRVGDMAAEIAHAAGEPPEWCERLRLAGRLHDIGKVAVPDAVLLKSGPLTVEEFELMKTHTTVGHQILVGSSSPLFQLAAELALTHHEWWDGRGYPHGRSGNDIPLSGRIVAMADVFDALLSRRAYKRAWPMAEAARFVMSGGGGQFDPELISSFAIVLAARHPELEPELR